MELKLKLSDGKELPLYFSTRAIENFCKKNGDLTVSAFDELITNNAWTYGHMSSIIFCCAQNYAGKHKQSFELTEYDIDDVMTELGGVNSDAVQNVLLKFVTTAYPQLQGMIKAEVNETPEKKSTSKKK